MNIKCWVTHGAFYRPSDDSSIFFARNGLLWVKPFDNGRRNRAINLQRRREEEKNKNKGRKEEKKKKEEEKKKMMMMMMKKMKKKKRRRRLYDPLRQTQMPCNFCAKQSYICNNYYFTPCDLNV